VNSKGQEFEVFNVLIGAVLAIAILVIIISIINYFEQIKVDSSINAIKQKLNSAAQSPDGSIFVAKEIIVPKDYSFNSRYFGLILNINEDCIEFDIPSNTSWVEYPNFPEKNLINFNKRIQTSFYVVCLANNDNQKLNFHDNYPMDCPEESCNEFCCLVSFGVNPALAND